MTRFAKAFLPALLAFAAPAFSSPLLDNPVTGTLLFGSGVLNYFDPANLFVPVGPANESLATVTILASSVPAWAFGYYNASGSRIDIEFDSGLNGGFQFTVSQIPVIAGPALPWTITLDWTSDPITDIFGVVTGNPFVPPVYAFSSGPRNVTLTFAGTGTAPTLTALADLPYPDGYSATFIVRDLSGVPEPATLGLVFGGLAGLGLVSRKRRG
jgi:hypothetical protein